MEALRVALRIAPDNPSSHELAKQLTKLTKIYTLVALGHPEEAVPETLWKQLMTGH